MSSSKYGIFDLVWALPAFAFEAASYAAGEASACSLRIRELNEQKRRITEEEYHRQEQRIVECTTMIDRLKANLKDEAERANIIACERLLVDIQQVLLPFLKSTAIDSSRIQNILQLIYKEATNSQISLTSRLSSVQAIYSALLVELPEWNRHLECAQIIQNQHLELLSDVKTLNKIMGKNTDYVFEWQTGKEDFMKSRLENLSREKANALWYLKNVWISGETYVKQQEESLNKVKNKITEALASNHWNQIKSDILHSNNITMIQTLYQLTENTAIEVTLSSSGNMGFEIIGLKNHLPPELFSKEYEVAVNKFIHSFPKIDENLKSSIGISIQEIIEPSKMPDIRMVSLEPVDKTKNPGMIESEIRTLKIDPDKDNENKTG